MEKFGSEWDSIPMKDCLEAVFGEVLKSSTDNECFIGMLEVDNAVAAFAEGTTSTSTPGCAFEGEFCAVCAGLEAPKFAVPRPAETAGCGKACGSTESKLHMKVRGSEAEQFM